MFICWWKGKLIVNMFTSTVTYFFLLLKISLVKKQISCDFLAISLSFHMWIVSSTRERQSHMNLCHSHAKMYIPHFKNNQSHDNIQFVFESAIVTNQDWWDPFKLSQNQNTELKASRTCRSSGLQRENDQQPHHHWAPLHDSDHFIHC